MQKIYSGFIFLFFLSNIAFAQQKKSLTHNDYDGWQSVSERLLSDDGAYVAYSINQQEGDGTMYVKQLATGKTWEIPRGVGAKFSNDNRFFFCKIKVPYADNRNARIKKAKPDDMPKDSMATINLATGNLIKKERVRSFNIPEENASWLAVMSEKPLPDTSSKKSVKPDSLKLQINKLANVADSMIRKSIDSVKGNIKREQVIKAAGKAVKEIYKKAGKDDIVTASENNYAAEDPDKKVDESNLLNVYNSNNEWVKSFSNVSNYRFDKKGTALIIETEKDKKDKKSVPFILWYRLTGNQVDTVMKNFNDIKGATLDETGNQLVFVAERDSSEKALLKFYKLWYYTPGKDSAVVLVEQGTVGMPLGSVVSENANLSFSKDGKKMFFGTAPAQAPKDTTLVDFELARLDIWNYNDDFLQPMQLKNLSRDSRNSFLAVHYIGDDKVMQLGSDSLETVRTVNEGDADWALAQTTSGYRKTIQWEGRSAADVYKVDLLTGDKKLIAKNNIGFSTASPEGKFVYWYNPKEQQYYAYEVAKGVTRNISAKIKEPLYDVLNDVPDYAGAMGVEGWLANDKYILIKGVYDIFKVDPTGVEVPFNLTNGYGQKNKVEFSYVNFDRDKRFINPDETIILSAQNKVNMQGGIFSKKMNVAGDPLLLRLSNNSYASPMKAKNAEKYIVQISDISESELYVSDDMKNVTKLTNVAAQQKDFVWPTAELVRWKMFDGKMSEGILYKPSNFDPNKQYPIIFYFYERNADGLYTYKTPAPSASIINIPYFVSNGYLVFDPNIYYKKGEPGESAYNSVVSAAEMLAKNKWVNSKKMAIQGQSWGGYQVAYLVTRTNMFAAAGAGAPVANMTSAYGGIRWGTGMNRQFQYEKTQSRIGATLWERPDLYIKNSPLFKADKVNTPLLLMHNDEDGSVPWYQSIEYFTALKRLGKKVWLLQYNGEDHNLVQRKNRKDLSRRLSDFFDYYLKDAPPAKWLIKGVPAVDKGIDWGFEVE